MLFTATSCFPLQGLPQQASVSFTRALQGSAANGSETKFLTLRIYVIFWQVLFLHLDFSAQVFQEKMPQNQDSHSDLYGKQPIKTTL